VIGHLGSRVSALLDGQLSAEETERAWEHVHACHACRDLVEREGWVKTRLAGLSFEVASPCAPSSLKGSLMGAPLTGHPGFAGTPGDLFLSAPSAHRRRTAGLAAIGGGAVGAAVMGVLVFGVAPADAPTIDRRAPTTSITQTGTPSPVQTPSQSVGFLRSRHAR
jgi:hypothetical protein